MSATSTSKRRLGVANTVSRPVWEEDDSWQNRAKCRGSDANLFFPPHHLEKKDEREARESEAKSICARCPVKDRCLAFALSTREPHGIWGGMNESERRKVLQRRAG